MRYRIWFDPLRWIDEVYGWWVVFSYEPGDNRCARSLDEAVGLVPLSALDLEIVR